MNRKKKTKNQVPETEESGTAVRREKAVSSLFASLLVLTLVLTMGYCTFKQFEIEREDSYASLRNSMYSLRSLISFEGSLQDAFANLRDSETDMYAELAKPFFEYLGVSVETLNDCKYNWEADYLYFFPDEGDVITTDNADPFTLNESQISKLKMDGMLFLDEWVYNAVRLKDGWLYIKWLQFGNIYDVDFQRIDDAVPSDLCIVENATGRVLISSSKVPYDFLDESRIVYDEEQSSGAADGIQAGFLKGKGLFTGLYFEKSQLLDRYTVYVYTPFATVFNDTLDKTTAVHALLIIIFFFIWFCSRNIRKKGRALLNLNNCLRLGKKRCFSLSVMRQLLPLLLSGILAALLFNSYLPLLTNYINHNVRMEKKLDAFVKELELNDEEWDKMESIYKQVLLGRMYMIDMFDDYMGEDFTQEVLMDLAQRMSLSGVTIYNAEGVSTMSTGYYVGYTISENPEDDEYILWNLLRNADTDIMKELPDKSGFYAASRRFFKTPGLIYITLPEDNLVAMKEQTDINTALLRINTETYAKMHTYIEEPETFLWATAASSATRSVANTLPQTVLMNRYCGLQTINGYTYYLNTMTDDNHVLVSAEQPEVFTAPIRRDMGLIIPEILLCSLLILCAACIYPYELSAAEDEQEKPSFIRMFQRKGEPSPEEQQLRMDVRKYCSELLWFLCALLVVFYFADALFSPHPMADYLFSHQWQREFSIFSVTTILLSVVFLAVGMRILKTIMKNLSAKMDSRAETFGDLIISIVQFILTVVIIIYSLHELGVDTNVILTSAGVVSLIIGYGSQSIVSDLVSGIFLIMEDQVRIGEFIEIEGFMGKVEHIGLRTTRASYENRTKVISNSNMVGFSNLSRESTPAAWTIGLPKKEDVDKVRALIEGNSKRFREVMGDQMAVGPIYKGMTKVEDGFCKQYVLLYNTLCDVKYWDNVRAISLEVAYKILMENGIQPISGEVRPL
ncbi:MAG: mechanosensitive ion channel [Solobacterium sp.]|nr:mechanosensitive ion channel [Solobacterium sp.]